jgi:hypothetical protein
MKTKNTIEEDLDAIRDQLYEKTKDMTVEERCDYFNSRAQEAMREYGFSFAEAGPALQAQEALRG